MKKQIQSLPAVLLATFGLICTMSSCVDDRYKIDDSLNKEMTFFQNGIELPLGTTPPVRLDSILKSLDEKFSTFFNKDADGDYFIRFNQETSLDKAMEEIRKFQVESFDGVSVSGSKSMSITELKGSLTLEKYNPFCVFDVVLPTGIATNINVPLFDEDYREYEGETIGKFGTFKVYPQGNPVMTFSVDLPNNDRFSARADNVKFVIPSIAIPDESALDERMTYNAADNSVVINCTLSKGSNIFEIPVKYLHICPEPKSGEEGKYIFRSEYALSGNVVFSTLSTGSTVSGQVKVQYNIPKFVPETIVLDNALSYELGGVDESFEIATSSVPSQVKSVKKVEFDDVDVCADIDFTGLPASLEGIMIDGLLELPDFFTPNVFEIKENIVPGTTLHFRKAVERISNVDISSGSIFGNAKFSGMLKSGANPSFNISDFGSTVKANVTISLGDDDDEIAISEVQALIDYELESRIEAEIENIPEELRGNVQLDLNPVISLAIKTNLGLPAGADLVITPVVDGQELDERAVSVSGVSLPVSTDPESLSDAFYLITSMPESEYPTPEGYTRITCDVSSLLENIPDKLAVTSTIQTDETKTAYLFPSANYQLFLEYDIIVPTSFGENFKLAYSKDVEGFNDFIDALKLGPLGIKGYFMSSIPLNSRIGIGFYDKDGAKLDVLEKELSIPINSGKGKGEAVKTDLNAIIKVKDGVDLGKIAAARFEIYLSCGIADVALNEKDYLQACLTACAPEGLTVNL